MKSRAFPSILILGLLFGTAQCSGQTDETPEEHIQVESRRLLKSGPDSGSMHHFYSDVSRDGSRLALHSAITKDISIRDFRTGVRTELFTPLSDSGYIETMRLSHDGSMVAFAECCDPGYFLRVGNTDGTDSRVLLSSFESVDWLPYVVPVDWVGVDSVLVLLQTRAARQGVAAEFVLVMVSVQDGSAVVFMEDSGFSYLTRLSPDGSRAVLGPSRVRIYDRATRSEIPVASNGWPLGWSEDGRHIFYVTVKGAVMVPPGRRTVTGLYRQEVKDDGSLGSPVAFDMQLEGVEPLTVVKDQVYSYVTASLPTLRMLSIDLEAGHALAAPIEITKGRSTRWDRSLGDWSPDGTRIAYLEGTGPGLRIITRSTLGNNRREYRLPEDPNVGDPWEVRWHPDGQSLYVVAAPVPGGSDIRSHLLRLHLDSGEVERLGRLRNIGFLGVSNDGQTLYVAGRQGIVAVTPYRKSGPNGTSLAQGVACTSESGVENDREVPAAGDCRTVVDLSALFPVDESQCLGSPAFSLSPDGETLAISTPRCVGVVPESGGTVEWLVRRQVDAAAVNWTPDGTGIIFQRRVTEPSDEVGEDEQETESGDQLVVYDLESGEERVVLEMDHIRTPRLSRDGSMLMYRGGEVTIEMWVAEEVE
jgi:Tol biopolymer transport system component